MWDKNTCSLILMPYILNLFKTSMASRVGVTQSVQVGFLKRASLFDPPPHKLTHSHPPNMFYLDPLNWLPNRNWRSVNPGNRDCGAVVRDSRERAPSGNQAGRFGFRGLELCIWIRETYSITIKRPTNKEEWLFWVVVCISTLYDKPLRSLLLWSAVTARFFSCGEAQCPREMINLVTELYLKPKISLTGCYIQRWLNFQKVA